MVFIPTIPTPMQLNSKRNQVKIRTFNIRKIPQVYSILFCTWYCNSTGIWPSHFRNTSQPCRWVLACAAGLIDPALKTTYPGTSPNSLSVIWRLIRSVSFSHSITSISMALMDTWRRATEHISTLPCLVQQAVWSTETIVCRIYIYTPSLHDQYSRHVPSKINHITPLLSTYLHPMNEENYVITNGVWEINWQQGCAFWKVVGLSVTLALSSPHSTESQAMNVRGPVSL